MTQEMDPSRALAICRAEWGLCRVALAEARERIRWLEAELVPSAPPQRPGLAMSRSIELVLFALRFAKRPLNAAMLGRRLDIGLARRGSVDPKYCDVLICRLRKKLKALSPPITIETARSRGWWLTDANKAKLQEFYDPR